MDRRKFINKSIIGGISAGIVHRTIPLSATEFIYPKKISSISIFSKHLQWLDYSDMAKMVAKLGFDGIDLTVRPGGHVLPENVRRDLPIAVEAIRNEGLDVPLISTSILDANDPMTHNILETAGSLGIKIYRTGWWKYTGQPIKQILHEKNKEITELSKLNEKYKIKGAYQNHAGNYVGAPCWDLPLLLNGVDPEWMGVQFDIRHAHVEGAFSWPYSLEILSPYINSIDIKDYYWELVNGAWLCKNTPLGKGMIDFKAFFEYVVKLNIQVDYSIHYEYPLGGAEHGKKEINISKNEFEQKIKKDLDYIKKFNAPNLS